MGSNQERISLRVELEGAQQAKDQLDQVQKAKARAAKPETAPVVPPIVKPPSATGAPSGKLGDELRDSAAGMGQLASAAQQAARPIHIIRHDIAELKLQLARVNLGENLGVSADQIRRRLAELRVEGAQHEKQRVVQVSQARDAKAGADAVSMAADAKASAAAMNEFGAAAQRAARPIDEIRADVIALRLAMAQLKLGADVGMSAQQIRARMAELRAEGGRLAIQNGDVTTGLQALGLAASTISPQLGGFIGVFSSLTIVAEGLRGSIGNIGLAFRSMVGIIINPVFLGLAAIVAGITTAYQNWTDATRKNREEHEKNAKAIADENEKAKDRLQGVRDERGRLAERIQTGLRREGIGEDQLKAVTDLAEKAAGIAAVPRETAADLAIEAAGETQRAGQKMPTAERLAELLAVQQSTSEDMLGQAGKGRYSILDTMAQGEALQRAKQLIPTDTSPLGLAQDKENYKFNLEAAKHQADVTGRANLNEQLEADIRKLTSDPVTIGGINTGIGTSMRDKAAEDIMRGRNSGGGGQVIINNNGSNNTYYNAPDARRGPAPYAGVNP